MARAWDVLLIGGPSGVGKTSVSYPLARRSGVGITEVDDLHIALECLTTPEQQPVLHYWRTHADAIDLPAEKILELHIAVCRVLSPAVDAVIANHLESHTPIVLEGDYLLPEVIADPAHAAWSRSGRVKAVFLYEPDEGRILRNLLLREPDAGEQTKRAHVSWLFGHWLKEACAGTGVAVLPVRPWNSLIERIGEAVS